MPPSEQVNKILLEVKNIINKYVTYWNFQTRLPETKLAQQNYGKLLSSLH